jgi:uncharacterized membrane protein
MNQAHLHLAFNHFPIVGIVIGFGILIVGIFSKNRTLVNTAYVLFIVATLFGLLSMNTGEGAEELVEDLPEIGHKIIHEHEELAEKFMLVLYALTIGAVLGLYFDYKKKSKTRLISYVVAIVSLIGVILAIFTGTSGGEIRHTEIREATTN